VAPLVFAALLIPDTRAVLHGIAPPVMFFAWFWGAMWGIGGLLFGLGVRYLGIALGYTVALGFSTAFGTLVPPLFAGQLATIALTRSGQTTLAGVALCLVAIAISGLAGRFKERELARLEGVREDQVDAAEAAAPGGHGEYRFGRGVVVASFAGIMSACFAYGLAAGKPISDAARLQLLSHGRSDLWQSLPTLIVVLFGGWFTNALWCGGLLLKNRSARQFLGSGEGPRTTALNYLFSSSAGLLWYLQFFFYSMGQARMGRYDFSSWTLHMAGTILFATLWGAVLHEWRGTSARTRWIGAAGFLLLVASTVVVGYGNYLGGR
jgi:L-rhamnose-H+ transport protein